MNKADTIKKVREEEINAVADERTDEQKIEDAKNLIKQANLKNLKEAEVEVKEMLKRRHLIMMPIIRISPEPPDKQTN